MFKKKIKNIYFKFFNKIIFLIGCIGLRRLRNTYKNITSLEDAELKIFSQGGDDGIIDYLLFSLNIKKPKFVEIGIQNYTESNTKFLYDRTSATVIDINPTGNGIDDGGMGWGPQFATTSMGFFFAGDD